MKSKDWLPAPVRSAGIERKMKAGETLFRAGSRSAGFYEVLSGKLRLVRVDARGREIVLFTAAAGDTLAEASLFSPSYHCDAVASTDAVVRLYRKPAILEKFERDPKTAAAFTAMLARQVMTLRARLEQRNIHSARERVRHYLALHLEADGRTVTLPGTLKELAGELGLSHETLYRTLGAMAADGEIERRRGSLVLKTPPI